MQMMVVRVVLVVVVDHQLVDQVVVVDQHH
jgi:hypothetical protein